MGKHDPLTPAQQAEQERLRQKLEKSGQVQPDDGSTNKGSTGNDDGSTGRHGR